MYQLFIAIAICWTLVPWEGTGKLLIWPLDEQMPQIEKVDCYAKDSFIKLLDDLSPIRIPLKRVGNLLFIEAQIDTLVGNFILDLGAPYLVLNSTYFREYTIDRNYYSGTLLSGTDYVRRTKISSLTIQDIVYQGVQADITDLGEIENRRGIKILGLLGVSLFKDYVIDLDVIQQQLVLHKSVDTVEKGAKLLLKTPIRVYNNIVSLKVKSRNVHLNLSLDTGAEVNIIDNNLPRKVYAGMKILKTSVVRDARGGSTEMLLVLLDDLVIGTTKLQRMQSLIVNLDAMSRAYGKKVNGMLGYPFFALGRVIIDFNNKQLSIYQKN